MYGSETPIDIHCSKLVDWLVQRRHCKRDWGEKLATIRRKIRAALGDMPENEEIKQFLIGSKLDYFKSKRIVEILKTTEASSKNIFGYYSSQRMKDWQDIVQSYERDYVYMAEVATDLIRETNYEVPGIRKVINKLNREKDEADKERANQLRRAQQFNSEHQKLAQTYGITGANIAQELEDKSKTLFSVMSEVVDLSKELSSALDYYRGYASSTSKQDADKFVTMLHYIVTKGNTTVYEHNYGEAPERIIVTEKATSSTGNSNPSEIELVDDEIDFGEDLPSSESSSGFVHVAKSDNGDGIIDETFIKVEEPNSQIVCDSTDKTASGDEAKLVLEFRKTRNQFFNNLYELEAFFVQLLNDQTTSSDDRSSSFVTEEGSRAQRYDNEEINQVLTKIRQILIIVNKEKNRILFQMNDSASYVENVKEKFAAKLKQASDCNIKADLLSDQIKELESQVRETESHLKKSIISAKELQEKVETSLRDLYKGRPINIMGCVN